MVVSGASPSILPRRMGEVGRRDSEEPSLVGDAEAYGRFVVVGLYVERTVALQPVVAGLPEGAVGIFALDDNLPDGVIVEAGGGDVRRTVAILVAVGAGRHAVVVVEASEEVELLPGLQPPYRCKDVVAGFEAEGHGLGGDVGVVEGVAVLVFVVCGVRLVVFRYAVGVGKVGVYRTAADYPVPAFQLEVGRKDGEGSP